MQNCNFFDEDENSTYVLLCYNNLNVNSMLFYVFCSEEKKGKIFFWSNWSKVIDNRAVFTDVYAYI